MPALALAALLLAPALSSAAEGPPRLTLEGIFSSGRFEKSLPSVEWIEGGAAYVTLEEDGERSGDFLRHEVATGDESVWLASTALVPFGGSDDDRLDVKGYRIGPGQRFVLLQTDRKKRWRHTHLDVHWIYDRQKRSLHRLSPLGRQLHASFSPDGEQVGFVSEGNLYVVSATGGTPRALTPDGGGSVRNGDPDWVYEEEFALEEAWWWSPDGARIAFLRFDEAPVETYPLIRLREDSYPELELLRYPKAGSDNSEVRLGWVDVASGRVHWVETFPPRGGYVARVAWTKDPTKLVYQRLDRRQKQLELVLVDTAGGDSRVILTERSEQGWIDVDDDLTFLEDGSHFLWTSVVQGVNRLLLYDFEGGSRSLTLPEEGDVREVVGVDELGGRVLLAVQGGSAPVRERHLLWQGLEVPGHPQRLTADGGWHSADLAPYGQHFIETVSTAVTPPRKILREASGATLRVVGDAATEDLEAVQLGRQEFFEITTDSGVELFAQRTLPPDFTPDRRHPVVMFCYGGPGSQMVRDAWYGKRGLYHQLLAAEGFVVVTVDNRGTYGRGKDFEELVYRRLGQLEADDQLAAARWLQSQDWVDPQRIGIWGWSYGGYLSAMTVLRSQGELAAAVSVAPVSDWRFYDTIYTERYMSTPEDNSDGYEKGSLLSLAGDLAARFLLVHGAADDNVHPQNSLRLVSALQKAGRPFQMMMYPDKNHGISGKATRLHLYTMMHDFLVDALASPASPPAGAPALQTTGTR